MPLFKDVLLYTLRDIYISSPALASTLCTKHARAFLAYKYLFVSRKKRKKRGAEENDLKPFQIFEILHSSVLSIYLSWFHGGKTKRVHVLVLHLPGNKKGLPGFNSL